MTASPAMEEKVRRRPNLARPHHSFYESDTISADAENAGSVNIDISLKADSIDFDLFSKAIVTAGCLDDARTEAPSDNPRNVFKEAIKSALVDALTDKFSQEVGKVVSAYRLMIRESLARGEDSELQAALNRARLQERILATTSMVDQTEACQLLGLSTTNPSATMKRKEEKYEVLRFTVDGRASYPLFQFDVEGRRVYPVVRRLIGKKPKQWSDFRLLHWLTRPHLDFESTPAEALGNKEEEVLAAFMREIEPPVHG